MDEQRYFSSYFQMCYHLLMIFQIVTNAWVLTDCVLCIKCYYYLAVGAFRFVSFHVCFLC